MNGKPLKTLFTGCIFLCISLLTPNFSNAANHSESAALTYTKQEIIDRNLTLDIELGETVLITDFENITKFVVLAPEKASAAMISSRGLSITGLGVGLTFIHIWDNQEIITIRVIIKHKGFKELEVLAEERRMIEKGEPIKIGYSYDLTKMRSRGDHEPYTWKAQDESHGFAISGDTPYGYFDGNYRYLFRKTQEGLADDTDSVYFKLENDDFAASFGDLYPYFSDITLPRTHLQGMRFGSGPDTGNFKYDFVAGSTGYYLWGSRLSNFGQTENRYYGLRAEISPGEDLTLFSTYMNSTKRREKVTHDLGSLGVKYKIGEYLYFETEAAKNNKKRTAWFSTLRLVFDKLSLKTTYRDINDEYLNLTGNVPYRGKRGIYTQARFNPYRNLSFSANFDVYQNRLYPDPDSVEKGNKDMYLSSRLFIPPTNTTFLVSLYHKDNRGQQYPVVSLGQSYEINQTLKGVFLLNDVYGYVRYTPSRYKSYITGESNYIDNTLRCGVRISPIRNLSLSVQETLNFREWVVRDYSTSPSRFEARASYGMKFGKIPFSAALDIGYQRDSHVNEDKISIIIGEDKITGGANLQYIFSPYGSIFLNGRIEKINGSMDPEVDRIETSIFGGAKFLWDTGITWTGHGAIEGFVFKDINRNGIMDAEDVPLKDARISVDKTRYAATNAGGFYRLARVPEGSRVVALDIKSIPENYSPTTSINVNTVIEKMKAEKVNFGIAPKTVIKGFIFNDLNRNKIFDDGIDEVLRNVLVSLDDGTAAFTDSYGYFTMHNVNRGEHLITVNKDTAPKGLLPEGPLSRNISVEEGETKEAQFVFYAFRAIAGNAYVDYNQNKQFDENEGMRGVKITCEGKSVISDEDGYFILRDLPAGGIRIIVDKESLPEDYDIKKDIIELVLEKRTDIREGINVELIRKP